MINLGLEPEEAVAMELEVEDVEAGERRKPIASYVPDRLAGLAAVPPGRAERDDHAAVHRLAG